MLLFAYCTTGQILGRLNFCRSLRRYRRLILLRTPARQCSNRFQRVSASYSSPLFMGIRFMDYGTPFVTGKERDIP